jgi:DNA modification methylase
MQSNVDRPALRMKSSDLHPPDGALSVFGDNLDLPRHRWYNFKEGFSDRLVHLAIESICIHGQKIRILDPFAGSGTTAVAAGRLGHFATVIEVNPFLRFAATAKCSPPIRSRRVAMNCLDRVVAGSRLELRSPLEDVSTFTQRNNADKWLFNRSVLRGFEAIDAALSRAGTMKGPLRLALFSSLMDCCNAKRDGKCLRYKSGWQSTGLDSEALHLRFYDRARQVIDDLLAGAFASERIRIVEGDCRERLKTLRARSYDLLVTSPPYLNSFDYSDVYRPELFAGRFVRSNSDLRKIRLMTIRSHVQVAWEPETKVASPSVARIVRELRKRTLWDHRLPSMVQSYFADIADVLHESHRVMKKDGQAWVVVSTSAYAGLHIPVDTIIAEIAADVGWRVRKITCLRNLRASVQHWRRHLEKGTSPPLRESLVVLEAK